MGFKSQKAKCDLEAPGNAHNTHWHQFKAVASFPELMWLHFTASTWPFWSNVLLPVAMGTPRCALEHQIRRAVRWVFNLQNIPIEIIALIQQRRMG